VIRTPSVPVAGFRYDLTAEDVIEYFWARLLLATEFASAQVI
jgi:hypothetical protein